MATITTGHDTTTTKVTPAPVKKVAKKQTPLWVILLSAPAAVLVAGGGMRLITELQDMGTPSITLPRFTETRQERAQREEVKAWRELGQSLDEFNGQFDF